MRLAGEARRILSLDIDGRAFAALADRDAVVAALQARYPGLRPVLFHSPYEAAAWAIIGQRIRITQAACIKTHIAETLGERVTIATTSLPAFPPPQRLRKLPSRIPGVPERKRDQLAAVARAAQHGSLDAATLRNRAWHETLNALQRLRGIGPFSADLILVRGAGDPDHFPGTERRLHAAMRTAYGLADDTPLADLRAVAETWRPYRSWVAVLLRTWIKDSRRGATPYSASMRGLRRRALVACMTVRSAQRERVSGRG